MICSFRDLARVALTRDEGAFAALARSVAALAENGNLPIPAQERDDAVQSVLAKLWRAGMSADMFSRMVERHPDLARAGFANPERVLDALAPAELLARADRWLTAYLRAMLHNTYRDEVRRRRMHVSLDAAAPGDLADPASVHGPSDLEAYDKVLTLLRRRAVADAFSDDQRRQLEESLRQLVALAGGEVTMDELTQQCVADDPELEGRPAARKTARDRLQQRHCRARRALVAAREHLSAAGELDEEDEMAARLIIQHLLTRRRQISARRSV
jgi:hypothetical protein